MKALAYRYLVALAALFAILGSIALGCSEQPAHTPGFDPGGEHDMSSEATKTPTPARAPGHAQVARSEVERDSSPNVKRGDVSELVTGNSAFGFDLYQALRDGAGNLFLSPYSISAALAMTYAGARAETERQMAETLHFTLPHERLHPAFNALDLGLVDPDQNEFKLHIANALWGQVGYAFLDDFLDLVARYYGAGLRLLDFSREPEESRQVINGWISDQTEEKIRDLIPQGGITPNTALVLANAIYFKADWLYQFENALTDDAAFHTSDGAQVTVPMMAMNEPAELAYAMGDGFQAIELPYKGGQTSMVIVVPDAGHFEAFEAALDLEPMNAILRGLEPKQVALRMPKFSYESAFGLAQTLAKMGMPNAFADADFSGMDGTKNLFISDVFHKAFVAVDEAGTEAAAATAVVMRALAMPIIDIELTIDRPFIFVIRDQESGSILFVGRVLNPIE
jgi:serpin B